MEREEACQIDEIPAWDLFSAQVANTCHREELTLKDVFPSGRLRRVLRELSGVNNESQQCEVKHTRRKPHLRVKRIDKA